ncbi:MAG: hypothetical protein GXN93_05700 [Candidatus Diapherotrites archaeon]|nr:hypothetical protein [Candidatus Diapherotrites archaeon]
MARSLGFWEAVFIIIGTQIGAGILALPYTLSHLGFFWGSVVLFVAAAFSVLTAVMLVESLYLSNPNYHYFDLASRYLGGWGKILVLLLLYSGYAAMLAYTSAVGQVLAAAAAHYGWGGVFSSSVFWSVALWLLISLAAYFGLRSSGGFESLMAFIIVVLVLTIFVWAIPRMKPYFGTFVPSLFVSAFSVAVFAFYAHSIIPEVVRGVRNMGRTVWAIIVAFSATFLIYTIFSFALMGVLGQNMPEIGTLGLTKMLDPELAFIGFLFPLLTIITSFLSGAVAQTDILTEVFGRRIVAWLAAVLPVIIMYLSGFQGFVRIITLGSLGMIAAAGIIPPLVLLRVRAERRRKLTPISDGLAKLTVALYAVMFVATLVSAVW